MLEKGERRYWSKNNISLLNIKYCLIIIFAIWLCRIFALVFPYLIHGLSRKQDSRCALACMKYLIEKPVRSWFAYQLQPFLSLRQILLTPTMLHDKMKGYQVWVAVQIKVTYRIHSSWKKIYEARWLHYCAHPTKSRDCLAVYHPQTCSYLHHTNKPSFIWDNFWPTPFDIER